MVADNNRVHQGDLLVELDKEPFQNAVAVKRAAVDTAKAELRVATATAHGIEAEARGQRWKLQHAIEDVGNQIALLRDLGRCSLVTDGTVDCSGFSECVRAKQHL